MAFASIALTDFLIEQGEGCIASFASSTTSERLFCKNCGTPLLVQDSIAPQSADFSLATLDDPAAATPGFHIYYNSRIAWAASADNLPCYPAGRDKDKI